MSYRLLSVALLFTALSVSPLVAETGADKTANTANGSVSGSVKDSAGAALAGAQIVLQPSGATVVSDAQGRYSLPNIQPGSYTITISYIGFKNQVQTVTVSAGQPTPFDVTLSVGSANQQVEVMANLEGDAAA